MADIKCVADTRIAEIWYTRNNYAQFFFMLRCAPDDKASFFVRLLYIALTEGVLDQYT